MKKHAKEILIFFLIFLVLVFLRLYLLDLRPLHHDEGVHGNFILKLIELGFYKYNPSYFHGPFLYYASLLGLKIFGPTPLGLRITPVFFGFLTFLLLFFLRKYYSFLSFVIVCLFYVLSPSISYYSRSLHHETFFVFFILAFYVSLIYFLGEKKPLFLYLAAAFFAFILTEKENFYIVAFIFFSYFFLANKIPFLKGVEKINFCEIFKKFRKEIFCSFILFLFIVITLYSNFFKDLSIISDIVIAPFKWFYIGTSDVQGHNKPFYYFPSLLFKYELPILFFGFLGIIYSLKKRKNLLLSWWAVLTILIYSLFPYKTPWLIINLTLPLILLSGYGIAIFLKNKTLKIVLALLLIISFIYLFYQHIQVNFIKYADPKNDFAYAQTTNDIKWVMEKIKNSGYKKVAIIGGKSYWPLPFYLYDYNVLYGQLSVFKNLEDYDILITRKSTKIPAEIAKKYRAYNFELRPNVWLKLYIEK